jgi:hypothetical protein
MIRRDAMTMSCVCVLLLGGCPAKKQPPSAPMDPRLAIQRIEARDLTEPAERVVGMDKEQVLAEVRRRLLASRSVRLVDKPEPGGYVFKLEFGIAFREDDTGAVARVVLASARANVPSNLEGAELQASTVAPLPRGSAERDLAAMKKVLGQILDDILFQAEIAVAPEDKLAAKLGAEKDLQRLAAAVEIVAVRRVKTTVPPLIALLRHKDNRISDRAIGALMAIGDRRAIKPLTELADLRDTEHMAKILDAIGTIGGQEAKDYLEFVSTGHEDTDIRNIASEALERMKRKESQRDAGH